MLERWLCVTTQSTDDTTLLEECIKCTWVSLSLYFEHTGHSSIDDDDDDNVDDDRNGNGGGQHEPVCARESMRNCAMCVYDSNFSLNSLIFYLFDWLARLTSLSISSYRHNLFVDVNGSFNACAHSMYGRYFLFYFSFVFIKV